MSKNSIGIILNNGSASDYITIKKQITISNVRKDTLSLSNKEGADNFLFNRNNNVSCYNHLRTAKSYELLSNYKSGQQNCCDISLNSN